MKITLRCLFAFLLLLNCALAKRGARNIQLDAIKLPPGFHISIYTNKVPGARQMALAQNGIIYVGTRTQGKIYGLLPNKNRNKAKVVFDFAKGLNMPNGVAYHQGHLYVAEHHKIIRFNNIDGRETKIIKPTVIASLPFKSAKTHSWHYLSFGPDNMMYVSIGAPCNVCKSDDARFASILRMRPDGKAPEIFAKGIRNSVGFTWHPDTKAMWFTNNGRDWLGDNKPPDQLNVADKPGLDFGFPYYHARRIPDPIYGYMRKPQGLAFPKFELDPHVAALGLKFYTGDQFPKAYHNRLFIAEHGSWNRSIPIGYRIMMVSVAEKTKKPAKSTRKTKSNKRKRSKKKKQPLNRTKTRNGLTYQPFATGWLKRHDYWGRPVDILMMPDGSMLVSDDYAGVIYRIYYQSSA